MDLLNVPITFNSVSVGKEQVSVGIGIDRDRVDRNQMGEVFVNARLEVEMGTAETGERNLPGIETDRVQIFGAFDSTSYSEKEGSFTTRLKTPKSAVEPQDFWNLSGRDGRLIVRSAEPHDGEGPVSAPLEGQREFPVTIEPGANGTGEEPEADDEATEDDDPAPMGPEEKIEVPIPESKKNAAAVFVQELEHDYWRGSWEWDGEAGQFGGSGAVVRDTRDGAIRFAFTEMLGDISDAEHPPSKAARKRRQDACKVIEDMRSDVRRGGRTVFDTHPAEVA